MKTQLLAGFLLFTGLTGRVSAQQAADSVRLTQIVGLFLLYLTVRERKVLTGNQYCN